MKDFLSNPIVKAEVGHHCYLAAGRLEPQLEERDPGNGNMEERDPGIGNMEERDPGIGNMEEQDPGNGNMLTDPEYCTCC